jgi:hypothetical protein
MFHTKNIVKRNFKRIHKKLCTNIVNEPSIEVKNILSLADAVCFDVDSTVIKEEGIDSLAEFKGTGNAVAEWTRKYAYCLKCFFFK